MGTRYWLGVVAIAWWVTAGPANAQEVEAAPEDEAAETAPEDAAPEDAVLDEGLIDEAALDAAFGEGDAGVMELGELDLGDEFALLAQEDVVVSATKHAQRISASPSAITVITREEILRSGYVDVADIMRRVPGADVFRAQPGLPAVGLRSNSSPAGDLILVLVDGRPVSQPIIGQPVLAFLPVALEEIERIEVIRGPGSSVYGANALQGVVNITTRRAGDRVASVEGSFRVSPGDTWAAHAVAQGTVSDWEYWFSGGAEHRSPPARPNELDLEMSRIRARVARALSEDTRLSLELGYSEGDSHLVSVLGPGTWDLNTPYAQLRLVSPSASASAAVEGAWLDTTADPRLTVQQSGEYVQLANFPPVTGQSIAVSLSGDWGDTLDTVFDGPGWLADHRLTLGTQGRIIFHRTEDIIRCPAGVDEASFDITACVPQNLNEFQFGAFLQEEWRVAESLTLTGTGRIDWNSIHPAVGLSPRLAAVWQPTDSQAFRLSYGQAFRKPFFIEAYVHVPLSPGDRGEDEVFKKLQYLFATQLGNPDLKNEKSDSVELGWRGELVDTLDGTVDLFFTRHDNEISMVTQFETEVSFGVPRIVSASAIYDHSDVVRQTVGGEATLRWRPTEWLNLRGFYGLDLHLEDAGDNFSGVEPVHRAGIFFMGHHRGLEWSLDGLYIGPYADTVADPDSLLNEPLRVQMGDWTLVNATLGYRLGLGEDHHVTVSGTIWNALDTRIPEQAGRTLADGTRMGGMEMARRFGVLIRGAW